MLRIPVPLRIGMDIPFIPYARVGGHDLLRSLNEAGKEAFHLTKTPPQLIVCFTADRQPYVSAPRSSLLPTAFSHF